MPIHNPENQPKKRETSLSAQSDPLLQTEAPDFHQLGPMPTPIRPEHSSHLTPAKILSLQRTIGNQAVQRLIAEHQANASIQRGGNSKPLLNKTRIASAISFNQGEKFSDESIASLRTILNVADDTETGITEAFVLAVAQYQRDHKGLGRPDGKIGSGTLHSIGENHPDALTVELKARVKKAKRLKSVKAKGLSPRIVDRIDKDELKEIIDRVAAELKISPNIVRGIIAAESGGDPNVGKGTKGYKGLMQAEQSDDQLDPETSIRSGVTKFLKFRTQSKKMAKDYGVNEELSEDEQVSLTMVSYNAGPGSVKKAMQYAQEAGDARLWFEDAHFIRSLMYYGAYSTSMMKSKVSALGGDSLASELEKLTDMSMDDIKVAYQSEDGKWDVKKMAIKFVSALEKARRDSKNPKKDRSISEAEQLANGWLVKAARFKHNNLRSWYVERVLKYKHFYDAEQGIPVPDSAKGNTGAPIPQGGLDPTAGQQGTAAAQSPAEANLIVSVMQIAMNMLTGLISGGSGGQKAKPKPSQTPPAQSQPAAVAAYGQSLLRMFVQLGMTVTSSLKNALGFGDSNGQASSNAAPMPSPTSTTGQPPSPSVVKAEIEQAMKQIKTPGASGNSGLIAFLNGQKSKMVDEMRATLEKSGTTLEDWFADMVPDATFLGVKIRGSGSSYGGVHKEMYARLKVAESILMDMPKIKALGASSPAELGSKIGVTDVGGLRAPKAATGGTSPSLHSYGIAVDINPAQNPYVRFTGGRIIERATELVLGEKITVDDRTDMVLHDVSKSMAMYDRLSRASEALKTYLKLRNNAAGVAALLAKHNQPHDDAAVNTILAKIKADYATTGTKVGSNNLGSNPAQYGIITLNRDVVEALVRAGLGWGGRYTGGKDIQHFDLDNATIKPKRRSGH